ncbi:MAG: hypothetical protein GEEBNDBF_02566 [bacterium]|nr:hypothetical protein [bacterium]
MGWRALMVLCAGIAEVAEELQALERELATTGQDPRSWRLPSRLLRAMARRYGYLLSSDLPARVLASASPDILGLAQQVAGHLQGWQVQCALLPHAPESLAAEELMARVRTEAAARGCPTLLAWYQRVAGSRWECPGEPGSPGQLMWTALETGDLAVLASHWPLTDPTWEVALMDRLGWPLQG